MKITSLPSAVSGAFNYGCINKDVSGISVVIPFRSDKDNARIKNVNVCIEYILKQNLSNIEIILSEESKEKSNIEINDNRIKHIFLHSDNLFNKSRAINNGVFHSRYNNICMNDCDIVTPNNYFYTMSNNLDKHESTFIANEIYKADLLGNTLNWNGKKRTDYFSGGSIGFTKDAFIKVGGMCEKFVGYGSEDCEFWTRINKTNILEDRKFPLIHIEHRRDFIFSQNKDIYDSIINIPIENRIEELKEDLIKKYNNFIMEIK